MKRLLLLLAVLCVSGPAYALINQVPRGDGTTGLVGNRDDGVRDFETCLGGVSLSVGEFGLTTLLTRVVVSPITNAEIRNALISVPLHHSTAQRNLVTIFAGSQTTWPLAYRDPLRGTTAAPAISHAYITMNSKGTAGLTFQISNVQQMSPNVEKVSHTVMRGDPIFIQSNGGWVSSGQGVITPTMVIYLCPR